MWLLCQWQRLRRPAGVRRSLSFAPVQRLRRAYGAVVKPLARASGPTLTQASLSQCCLVA